MNIEIIILAALAWAVSCFALHIWLEGEEMLEEINGTDR